MHTGWSPNSKFFKPCSWTTWIMQHSPKPIRTAKAIASLRLLGRTLNGNSTPARPQPRSRPRTKTPAQVQAMAGVSIETQTELVPQDHLAPHQGDEGNPTPPEQTMQGLHSMIKDLTARMDRKSKSRSRSGSTRRSPTRAAAPPRDHSPADRYARSRRSTRSPRRRSRSAHSSRRRSRRSRSRSRSRSRTRSRSRRRRSSHSSRHSPSRQRQLPRPAPADHRTDISTALAAQYPPMGNPSGKRLPITGLALEPYKCLPPDLRKIARERRARRDLTFPEHVCGYLKMVTATMDNTTEAYAALHHLSQVAQDAAVLPWQAMREWSLACMVHIDDGGTSWHDVDLFTKERTRLSWMKGRQLEVDRHYPCLWMSNNFLLNLRLK